MSPPSLYRALDQYRADFGLRHLGYHDAGLCAARAVTGLLMIPGTYIGRNMLRLMANGTHDRLVDGFAILGGLNFLYLAITG